MAVKALVLAIALLLVSRNDAFAPLVHNKNAFVKVAPLFMAEDTKKADLVYDDVTGKFVEEGKQAGVDCIPEDEYCAVDKKTGKYIRLTLEEKERIFMDALQSYYVNGRQLLDDGEFDLLKEDLQWSGSDMVVMNRKEAMYLAAVSAYLKGDPPIMEDAEYNALKQELKETGSKFAVSTEPKCYIDTGICTVTFQEDFFRSNLLYLPAGGVLTTLWLGLGFELLSPIARLNPLVLLLVGSPLIFFATKTITEDFLFQKKFIAYGPCPSCEVENRVYFGDILFVEGFDELASVKCPNCKVNFQVQRDTLRASTVPKN